MCVLVFDIELMFILLLLKLFKLWYNYVTVQEDSYIGDLGRSCCYCCCCCCSSCCCWCSCCCCSSPRRLLHWWFRLCCCYCSSCCFCPCWQRRWCVAAAAPAVEEKKVYITLNQGSSVCVAAAPVLLQLLQCEGKYFEL